MLSQLRDHTERKKCSKYSNQTLWLQSRRNKPSEFVSWIGSRTRYLINLRIVLTFNRQQWHFVIAKIQLTNYLFDDFQLRAPVIFSRSGRRRASMCIHIYIYRIFRDKSSFSGLADDENSVLLIETTQLLLGSDRSIQLRFTRQRQNSKQFRPLPSWMRDTG